MEELLVEQGEEPCLSLEVVGEEEEEEVVAEAEEQPEAALKLTAEEAESLGKGRSHCRSLQSQPRLLLQRHRKQFSVVRRNPAVHEVTLRHPLFCGPCWATGTTWRSTRPEGVCSIRRRPWATRSFTRLCSAISW